MPLRMRAAVRMSRALAAVKGFQVSYRYRACDPLARCCLAREAGCGNAAALTEPERGHASSNLLEVRATLCHRGG